MSKQALDVKLCDMLYNVNDYADKKQRETESSETYHTCMETESSQRDKMSCMTQS